MAFASLKKNNPKHLKKGTFGYWREQLSPEQQEKAQQLTGPLLEILEYDRLETTPHFSQPKLNLDYDLLKSRIIASQKGL